MGKKISIIGLGQIGSSIGLALQEHSGLPKIVGYDADAKTALKSMQMGAVSQEVGLRDAARDAALVFLCTPLHEMPGLLERMRPHLPADALVFETGPSKGILLAQLDRLLPSAGRYIGLFPAPSNDLLASPQRGIDGASADFFRRSVMVVVLPPKSPPEVEQAAMNVVRLLGAKPMLTDPAEADGLATAVHLMPQLLAAALLEATVGSPGWLEARKLAGQPFTAITGGAAYYDQAESLRMAALANREAVLRRLDLVMGALQEFQDDLRGESEGPLGEHLAQSFLAREQWLDERGDAAWLGEGGNSVEVSGAGDQMLQLLFGGGIVERTKLKGKRG